jgi:DEAD/DEAH box helicase domain-containing protein
MIALPLQSRGDDMEDHVVVDVEIQKTIEETPGGWDATDKLGVACACLYEFRGARMRIFGPEDVDALKDRLLSADRISGYNIYRFDFPVIWGLPARGRVTILKDKTNDILMRIWRALGLNDDTVDFTDLHKGWSLDVVAKGTLGKGKIGYGGDAPKWFQAGQWGRVANYCADDVALERDLADFVDKYGFVVNGKTGQVLRLDKGMAVSAS